MTGDFIDSCAILASALIGFIAGRAWGRRKPRRPDYEPYG